MSAEIFRTFGRDTMEYSELLVKNPTEACRLFQRLRAKYGV